MLKGLAAVVTAGLRLVAPDLHFRLAAVRAGDIIRIRGARARRQAGREWLELSHPGREPAVRLLQPGLGNSLLEHRLILA